MAKRAWLMKSEPDVFGIDHLRRKGRSPWDGVRNFQARNFMMEMKVGDDVLFYHSSADPSGAAGLARVCRLAYPDHTAQDPTSAYHDPRATPADPRWFMVDVEYVATLPRLVPLAELRTIPALADMLLFRRGSRLSIQPITRSDLATIKKVAARRPPRAA